VGDRNADGPLGEAGTHARSGLAYGAAVLAITAVAATASLLLVDIAPVRLSEQGHAEVSALPLALVAVAYLAHQPLRRPTLLAVVQAALLASAFLLWAAYQLDPTLPVTVNHLAITLFILDLALVIGSDLRRAHAAAVNIPDRRTHPSTTL
jgi:hypothetical protein